MEQPVEEFVSPPPWTPVWLPMQFLNRKTDNTYLVRVENDGGAGIGKGWIDKGYFADDAQHWTDDSGKPIEQGPWKITAFAPWPDLKDISVSHASDCATSSTPAYPAGPCDCGADAHP